jgi:Toxin with endonuclease activity, of toxin-antitoxin system
MEAEGWALYLHPLFQQQLEKLTAQVEALKAKDPLGYKQQPATKLLATLNRYVREIIPRNPNAAEFRQGNTLGPDNRHWFRAKFHGALFSPKPRKRATNGHITILVIPFTCGRTNSKSGTGEARLVSADVGS